MKKKVLAVLLGGCMVVGMLAGCGGGGDDAKKDEGAKTEATDEGLPVILLAGSCSGNRAG